MTLSIIIPVYNVVQYLKKCVESAADFPISDKEIILVDDGSTDGSGELCDEIQKELQFKRCSVKVIHQKNQGVSVARNAGIDASSGDWLWFVDSDDTISFKGTIDAIQLDSANFVVTGFSWKENGNTDIHGASRGEVPYNLWRCWFRSSIVKELNIRFVIGRKYAEDQEFILNYLLKGERKYNFFNKTYPINYPVYSYTMRPGSAMTKSGVKYKKLIDVLKVDLLFAYQSLTSNSIMHKWVLSEIKRMTKVVWVILIR